MSGITILCYHKVGPIAEEGRFLNVEPSTLRQHVRFISRRNRIICAKELAHNWTDSAVCFTFDDAYESTMENAPRIFEEFQQRATFFPVAGLVGTSSVWDAEKARPLADWKVVLEAHKRGHEIGNHTTNHPHLNSISKEEQLHEVSSAHQTLVGQGLVPVTICYPYGGYNEDTLSVVQANGYAVGLSLRKGVASERDDRLALPRIAVGYSDSVPMLFYKMVMRPRLRKLGL